MKSRYFIAGIIFLMLFCLNGCQRQTESKSHPLSQTTQKTAKKTEQAVTTAEKTSPKEESNSTAAVQPYSWYFTRNSQHQIPYVNQDICKLLAANNAFYVLPNNSNKIYLTFDAGYELGYTAQILDTLKSNGVHAAFFITGQYLHTQPELVKRMKAEGNLVCNHTLNHPDCARITSTRMEGEMVSLQQEYRQLTGQEIDHYFRPPMGNYSESSLQTANKLGYKTVFWSIAFNDWDPSKQPGADYSFQHVAANIHPGAVILLHAVSQSDTDALDRIIKYLQGQGYVFATFAE
ncbi:MAG TPA: polysaccharide deacetylase family protein [Syntrophomonadaceae bacterium]|nr:polysaccharide deacetylase family protein [Syntrophomonadaceae bacterium]